MLHGNTAEVALVMLFSLEGGDQLADQIGKIPIIDAVQLNIVVFKAVQLLQGDFFSVELTENRSAVTGA